jgi:pilus assembly protein CpaF
MAGNDGLVAKPKGGNWKQESGPLKAFIDDPEVSEIMVNRFDRIFIEKAGVIQETGVKFDNPDLLLRFANAAAVAAGRDINRRHPCIDARLPDGSRLSIIIPPVALEGPIITMRKHARQTLSHRDLTAAGSIDEKMIIFLYHVVRKRQNIMVSGGTSSGKTTLLNVLSSFISSKERIITLEDTAELQLHVKNLVRMETHPPAGSDPGVSMRELVISALRMRPDRIVIGECRGGEAWDMLMAMNTGHEGSMTTLHANSAYDALRRMEAMIIRSGQEAPLSMIKTDIASTINFIVHMERSFDGNRRVTEIVEVAGRDGEGYTTRDIFKWSQEGGFKSTGVVPRIVGKIDSSTVNDAFFAPDFVYKPAA